MTQTLQEKVNLLIEEVDSTHRYSMSRIYGLYNEVFSVSEAPQACASCLIRKVNQLKLWLSKQAIQVENIPEKPKETSKKKKKSTRIQ